MKGIHLNLTIKILKVLREKGELTLEDLFNLIPKNSKGHRDLYPLASLISLGYLEDDMLTPIEDKKKENIYLIAYKLYAWRKADDDFAEYKDISWKTSCSKLKHGKFAITGEGYLYLDRELTQTNDRRFLFLLAILSAVLGSPITSVITNLIN